jgi:hypothetical protein
VSWQPTLPLPPILNALSASCHPDRSAAQWRDLRFSGPFVEMFFERAQRSGEICGFLPIATLPFRHFDWEHAA